MKLHILFIHLKVAIVMKIYKYFPLTILIIIQWGCGSNKFLTLQDSPDCTTTIEGNFITPKVYKYPAPVVLFNKGNKYSYSMGAVISQNIDGVFMVGKTYSMMDSPDTSFIEFSKIRAIIDSNYFCVYGDIQKKECSDMSLKLYLEKLDEPEYKPIYLELVSNQKFSFCVKPGKYRLVKIVRELSDGDYWYESFPVFNSIIHAEVNQANYIGNITLLTKEKLLNDATIIPYFKQVNENNAGAAFGIIGGVVAKLSNSSWKDKIRGYYYLTISIDDNYISDSKNKLNICPLKFDLVNY